MIIVEIFKSNVLNRDPLLASWWKLVVGSNARLIHGNTFSSFRPEALTSSDLNLNIHSR